MACKESDYVYEFRIIATLNEVIKRNNEHPLTSKDKGYWGRALSVDIFEMTTVYTGFTSEEAMLNMMERNIRPTLEHHHPRQYAGETLIEWVLDQQHINAKTLTSLLLKFREVNRVSKRENQLLKPFQKPAQFISASHSYAEAGIKLHPLKLRTRKKQILQMYPHLAQMKSSDSDHLKKRLT